MIYLNCGNLWTYSYLDKVIELNKLHAKDGIQVKSLFGSVSSLTPTARSADRLPFVEKEGIAAYVNKAKASGINIRYTLNQSCIGSIQDFKRDWDDRLKDNVHKLSNFGIQEWTVTSPLLVELLRDMLPDDFIEVSTIAEVSSVEEAQRWKDLGADGVNVSTSINRDFNKLRDINRILKVAVLANEACLYRCPWRRDCYNLSSHDSLRSEELFGFYPFRRCNMIRLNSRVEWLKSRLVLPQWLSEYQFMTKVDWFKVAFRTHPEEVAMPILKAYMNMDYVGNLCDLWPTISRLGNTPEPREATHISCKRLDEVGFLGKWYKKDDCPEHLCGGDCSYCYDIYEKVTQK